MGKVYVLSQGAWSDRTIVGVYSSPELAMAATYSPESWRRCIVGRRQGGKTVYEESWTTAGWDGYDVEAYELEANGPRHAAEEILAHGPDGRIWRRISEVHADAVLAGKLTVDGRRK